MSIDLMVVGGCTVDTVVTAMGEKSDRQLGGSGIYAAVGARVWGLQPGVVAIQGTGMPVGWKEPLSKLGIDLEGLIPVPLPAPAAEFLYHSDGSRVQRVWAPQGGSTFAPHVPSSTAEPIRRIPIKPRHIPERYREARGVHLAPLQYPVQLELEEELAAARILTLDPYPFVMAECSDTELEVLLRPLTAFLPSQEEVTIRFSGTALDVAARTLRWLGAAAVAIKLGRAGSSIYDFRRERRYALPAIPVTAKDPTGAGDAFCGGFLAGLLQENDFLHAGICGTVAASFVVEDFCFFKVLTSRSSSALRCCKSSTAFSSFSRRSDSD